MLILALFVAVASAQQYCTYNASVTKAGLYDQNGLCNCYSGYYSSEPNYMNCFNTASDSCFWNPAPEQLSTGYVPILDDLASGVFSSNIVMVVRSPLVINRLTTTAAWQNGAAAYSYPGSYWSKTVDNCTDMFTFILPLSSAYDAGFEPSEDDTYFYLNGVIVFTYYDSIGEIRGQPLTRTTQSVLRIEIRFPKRITVTSAVSVYSGYDLLAVITYQAYDPISNTGIFEYTTSLPYPFRVNNVTGLTFPSPLAGSSGQIEDLGCNTTVNSNCLQKFRLTINPNGACRLSGDYNITVALGCRGDANCPPGSGVIASQITSEDICSVVRIDIDLTGSMKVYSDDTFTSPASAFLPGQSAVFLTNVGSTKAIIASSSISDVFYTMPDGTSNSLYSGGAETAKAASNGFSIVPLNATASYFTVTMSVGDTASDLFSPRALDPTAFPPITTPSASTTPSSTTTTPSGDVPVDDIPPVAGDVPFAAPPPVPFFLDPILDCVEQVGATSYIAHFSYQNPLGDVNIYDVGVNNGFSGNGLINAYVNQPISFPLQRSLPYPIGAFQYQWNGAAPVIWNLNGVAREGDANDISTRCPTTIEFEFSFFFSGSYPQNQFEQGLILNNMRQIMNMNSVLNLLVISSNIYNDPTGAENFVSIRVRIDPSIEGPEISAKEAFINLYTTRYEEFLMNQAVNPLGYDPQRRFGFIIMSPLNNEVKSFVYPNAPLFTKRSAEVNNVQQEEPQRREIVHTKREVEQDVSGNVQFSAVIEVEWVGLNGNKKRFAFDLQQASLPSGSQDKKFSTYVGIGKATEETTEPSSYSTNLPGPTSSAPVVYASISILIIALVSAML